MTVSLDTGSVDPKARRCGARSCCRLAALAAPVLVPWAMLAIVAAPLPAAADDHFNLEEGLPVSTEDAYAIEYGGQELQGVFSYERSRDGKNLFTAEPRLALGVFPGFQATPRVSYSLGNGEGRDSGSVGLDGLYQLNQQTELMPVFAVSGSLDAPYGYANSSPETGLKLIAAKSLGDEKEGRDIHLNLGWVHNYGPTEEERADRFNAGIAYAQPLTEELIGVVDIVREEELERNRAVNLFEFGARYRVAENLAVAAGVGIGFGPDSPGVRVTIGFQRALDLFGSR